MSSSGRVSNLAPACATTSLNTVRADACATRPLYERALGIAVAAQGGASERATALREALAGLP